MYAVFSEGVPEFMCLPPPHGVTALNQPLHSIPTSVTAPGISLAPAQILHPQPGTPLCLPSYGPGVSTPYVYTFKRGSEELMSHSPVVANGNGLSPQQSPNELTDAKKAKLDSTVNPPSRVVHIRSLPGEAGETDIVQLGMPFGKMTNVLVLKQKNQAFLEFQEEASAVAMVSYFQANPAQIRLKPVFVQFSNHKELKTDASHAFQNANAQAALQAAHVVMGSDEQSTILRVIVDNAFYPVSLEILHQLFIKFGKVLKIITFTKNNTFQALIQMSDAISAAAAKTSLDGQNIYNGCNTLKIDYSKLSNLNVKYNNDKSRDFTRPDLPTGDLSLDAMSLGAPGYGIPGLSFYSGVPVGTMSAINAMGAFGLPPGALGAARIGLPLPASMGSSVILVSNLDEEMVTPDALFTLFGVYGDVHRVKVLFNKKDNALIQMADPHQAQLAITYLDKARVWGKQIRVAQSKHQVVQMPKEGQSDAGLTKDFVNSPLHRFKRPGSKNCQNIFPPSQVLHLSNIPVHVTEENLTTWFSDHGTVKAFKFFPKDRKMALIQMSTVEEAIHALVAMHNYQMGESCHLRVSFSKSTI
ncbi:polypyrimidine tract-binding protein 2-like isoform X6 [Physella acuta]|uniref:polypyrimidine tract-binding protein 2-like isoform X6 n=1 Tax=Physella acuta TaxID=109671 RepID=UPI0027DBFF58|nr:polypyrimidine tract-binding protein 2-like isoform X6 [Physella acuta]